MKKSSCCILTRKSKTISSIHSLTLTFSLLSPFFSSSFPTHFIWSQTSQCQCQKKASEHFDTFVSSTIAFAKSDDNSKFNEYLCSLLHVNREREYDNAIVSDSESEDSDNEKAGLWMLWMTATDFIFHFFFSISIFALMFIFHISYLLLKIWSSSAHISHWCVFKLAKIFIFIFTLHFVSNVKHCFLSSVFWCWCWYWCCCWCRYWCRWFLKTYHAYEFSVTCPDEGHLYVATLLTVWIIVLIWKWNYLTTHVDQWNGSWVGSRVKFKYQNPNRGRSNIWYCTK